MLELGDGESRFIIKGIENNIRIDGRKNNEYRQIFLENNVLPNCSGSSHIKIANTEVMVGIKTEIYSPDSSNPDQGIIDFYIECSPNSTITYTDKSSEEICEEIKYILKKIYKDAINRHALLIHLKEFCWKLLIEILIIQHSGNIFDTISLGVKAALWDLKIPIVQVKKDEDINKYYIELSDNPNDDFSIDTSLCPSLITSTKIGGYQVIDALVEEESCAIASLVIGVSPLGQIVFTKKVGNGSLNPNSIQEMIKLASATGIDVHNNLMSILSKHTR